MSNCDDIFISFSEIAISYSQHKFLCQTHICLTFGRFMGYTKTSLVFLYVRNWNIISKKRKSFDQQKRDCVGKSLNDTCFTSTYALGELHFKYEYSIRQ